jgi:hypothetical protein
LPAITISGVRDATVRGNWAAKGVWLVHDSREYLLTYGVCKQCALKREQADEAQARAIIDLVEQRLIDRYPHLKELIAQVKRP